MKSKGWIFVASLCLLTVLLAAIVPTAADAPPSILGSVAALGAPASVGCPLGSVLVGPPDTVLVDRAPARAPPLA